MIELSDDLSLDPSEAATQTFGVIAAKGGGKSYLATKFAEGLYDAGAPFVALDPVGNWSALTLDKDGKSPGLSVVVIGGERADVPLVEEHADRLGTFLVLQGLQAVIDLSELSKKRRKEYVADLCEAMYQAARSHRSPFMVIFEEAQVFAPERPQRGEERMLGAVTDIVRLGRNYGLGSMMVSQRPQSVSKEVLNLAECLFVGQLRGPHERKRIGEWVTAQGVGITKEVLKDLPQLEVGEFCAWSPSWLRVFKRIRIRTKRTFDGSSTPKLGAKRATVGKSQRDIADVVGLLQRLYEPKAKPAPTAAEAELDVLAFDTGELEELRSRVGELESENESLWHRIKTVRQSYGALRDAVTALRDSADRIAEAIETVMSTLEGHRALEPTASPLASLPASMSVDAAVAGEWKGNDPNARITKRPLVDDTLETWGPRLARVGRRAAPPVASVKAPRERSARKGTPGVGKPESAVLGVLAQQREPIPKGRLAMLAGYSPSGGAFGNCLSRLRVAGWIEGSGELAITRAGRAVAPRVAPLPTGQALIEHWRQHSRMDTPMRAIFSTLVMSVHPLTREAIAKKTGYQATAGNFGNALSRLRVLGVVHGKGKEPIRLYPALEEAARSAA